MGTGKSSGGTKQDFYKLDSQVGIEELNNNQSLFSIFPNPVVTDYFIIKLETELKNASVSIFNPSGSLVKRMSISSKECKIDRTDLSAGIYFISIENKDQLLSVKKIILQ